KVIHKSLHIQSSLQNDKIKNVLSQIHSIPSLPTIYQEIMNLLKKPDTWRRPCGNWRLSSCPMGF
ncbi:MAG: hypothetical protein KAI81_08500, partial [Candidatus Marinimicrobia bacterium]|nr:hypothetical protein [Candidatus Neomarinimicrobiota bacterium]